MINIKQGRNLHSLWDGLLGTRYDEGDINKRLAKITTEQPYKDIGRQAVNQSMLPKQWVIESRNAARQAVYTPEVMSPIQANARGMSEDLETINLSEEYLKNAGEVARIRAAQAGHRLAEVWRLALAK